MLDLIVNPYAGRGRAKTDAKKVFEILDANGVKFAPHYTARKNTRPRLRIILLCRVRKQSCPSAATALYTRL